MKRLRILMVLHMPWDRDLGAPRVQLELAEELGAQGHVIDKYDLLDAFPRRAASSLRSLVGPTFARRAAAHVRDVGADYDVIEAQQGDLPFHKASLGFEGLLVARSCGLYPFYRDFERYGRRRWTEERGRLLLRPVRRVAARREEGRERSSLRHADLVSVPNGDELAFVRDRLQMRDKCVLLPNALTATRLERLRARAGEPSARLSSPRVAFIGQWSARKGRYDWGELAGRISSLVPDVGYTFLGTGCDEGCVKREARLPEAADVRVVPRYRSEELPALLADATVGVLPSYVEGFGLGALEQLAAGVPTVAYDVPGPRETVGRVDRTLLTPRGDPAALADRAVSLARLPLERYAELSACCIDVARDFSWSTIAPATARVYRERLSRLSA